jgi:hypothetical protein
MAFAFAELLNQEALALQADGVDIIQFDEPAFNVYMKEAADWGVQALERAAQGLTCTTAVHICYGYGIQANVDWKQTLGDEWRQYEQIFPALARSSIQQVSLECYHSHVPPHLMKLLEGKDVLVGVIDVASDVIETPEQVADTIGTALQFVPKNRLFACTNCGLAPMSREVAEAKLEALAQGRSAGAPALRRLRHTAMHNLPFATPADVGLCPLRAQRLLDVLQVRDRPAAPAWRRGPGGAARQGGVVRAPGPPGPGRGHADDARFDLPHLLDDQADCLGGHDDADGAGPAAAE